MRKDQIKLLFFSIEGMNGYWIVYGLYGSPLQEYYSNSNLNQVQYFHSKIYIYTLVLIGYIIIKFYFVKLNSCIYSYFGYCGFSPNKNENIKTKMLSISTLVSLPLTLLSLAYIA